MLSTLSMPVITQTAPLMVADVIGLPYSSTLLLDSKFDASITDDADFREACEWGFAVYFEDMYERDEAAGEFVFVERRYGWDEVVELIVGDALAEDDAGHLVPCAERAGIMLGWLSALALTDRARAGRALVVAEALLSATDKGSGRELVA